MVFFVQINARELLYEPNWRGCKMWGVGQVETFPTNSENRLSEMFTG